MSDLTAFVRAWLAWMNQPENRALRRNVTDVTELDDTDIRVFLVERKGRLGVSKAPESAQRWWRQFETETRARPALALRLAEEILARRGTLADWARTLPDSNDPAERLAVLEDQLIGLTNIGGWTDEQIGRKLAEVKKTLGWEETPGSARKWWSDVESKSGPAAMLRLAEELANRKATIAEFFIAHNDSGVDNLQGTLHYLDYSRLKKQEERKKEAAKKEEPKKEKG
jgi:hypothetical protein